MIYSSPHLHVSHINCLILHPSNHLAHCLHLLCLLCTSLGPTASFRLSHTSFASITIYLYLSSLPCTSRASFTTLPHPPSTSFAFIQISSYLSNPHYTSRTILTIPSLLYLSITPLHIIFTNYFLISLTSLASLVTPTRLPYTPLTPPLLLPHTSPYLSSSA